MNRYTLVAVDLGSVKGDKTSLVSFNIKDGKMVVEDIEFPSEIIDAIKLGENHYGF